MPSGAGTLYIRFDDGLLTVRSPGLHFNPLSPHDAPKRHFASLKNASLPYTMGVIERTFE